MDSKNVPVNIVCNLEDTVLTTAEIRESFQKYSVKSYKDIDYNLGENIFNFYDYGGTEFSTVTENNVSIIETGSESNNEENSSASENHSSRRLTKLDEIAVTIPLSVQINLFKLIERFSFGLRTDYLPFYYREMYKKELDFWEYKYESVIQMCMELKHIFHYASYTNYLMLYAKNQPIPENLPMDYKFVSWDSDETKDLLNSSELIIEPEIYTIGNEIPRQFLPIGTKVGNEMSVTVSEIYDPSTFWVYIDIEDKRVNEFLLDKLMDEMEIFYSEVHRLAHHLIPAASIKKGLYCVAIVGYQFRRVKVLQVLPESEVKVYCIDFGTVRTVSIKNMIFLNAKFATLPAQAIRCRLSNISPTSDDHVWTRSSTVAFREMIEFEDTIVKISHIDWDNEIVEVIMTKTIDDDTTNIYNVNEALVKNGHAIWEDEARSENTVHVNSTFKELEDGLVPYEK